MIDIAVHGGSSVAQQGYRSERADRHAEQTVSDPAAAGLERRIDAVRRQWHDGWRTAQREGWTVSPPRSMRCEDADCPDSRAARKRRLSNEPDSAPKTSSTPPVQIARFFARERRALAVDRQAGGPDVSPVASTAAPSDVVSRPVPRQVRIKTTYTTAEVFRALSQCSAPFTHASQIADDLFTMADYPTFTPEKRTMLRSAAIMTDQLAGMATNVFLMQSICKVFGIIANLLDGQPMTPDDVLDVNMLSRSVMALKRGRSPLYLKGVFIKEMARLGIDQTKRPSKWPDSYLTAVQGGATGGHARAGLPEIDGRPITSLELFYSEAGDRTVMAPAVEIEAGNDEARSKDAVSLAGAAEVVVPSAPERVPDADEAVMARIASGMQAVAVEWSKVQSVPIRRPRGAQTKWEQVPISEYAVGSIDARGRDEGELFVQDGKAYLCLAGRAVAVRKLFPEQWWIVDNHAYPVGEGHAAHRLPPMPLRKVIDSFSDRLAVEEPTWVDVPEAHGVPVGDDGYIRYQGRKFIEIAGKRVAVSFRPIQGEDAIVHFGKVLPDVLPAADAMQIIRLDDGSRWIEGTHGYYRLRFDLALRDFYLLEAGDVAEGVERRRALVDFDIDRQRWTALVGRRRSGYEDILAARYLLVEDPPTLSAEGENEGSPMGGEASAAASQPGGGEWVKSAGGKPSESERGNVRTALLSPVPEEAGVDGANVEAAKVDAAGVEEANVEEVDALDASASLEEANEGAASDGREFELTFPLYASAKTGLEREFALFGHYAAHLKRFPFFSRRNLARGHRRRISLRKGLRKTLARLQDTSMVAVNRMEPAVRVELAPRVLSLRQRLVALYPSAQQWSRLTLQEKQQQVSHMVQVAYRESAEEMWPCLSGYCNEIADVVLSAVIQNKPKLRDHLMQLALYDQKGAKGTHVMLLYADQPAALDVFADRASQDIQVQRLRPTFNEADFYDWLMVNRDAVLLIDAWATNKLVDLSEATSHALVSHELMPNLMEAGFNLDGRPRFHVRAVLPRRPANAVRPRRDVDSARVLSSAPATWEVLAAWAVTGALPSGASASALSADLSAAADSERHDAARQSLLRTLAVEIMPKPENGTAEVGIDRRTLVMVGQAAWALLNTSPTVEGCPASANVTDVGWTPDAAVTTEAFDRMASSTERADDRLASYASILPTGEDHSAVQRVGTQAYVWMPGGRYYPVREIMPGRLFIVDPDESPFGRPSLPPIPLERDGALWRVAGA